MLTNLVVTYLEANPKAILSHELDWMPIESRSALFHQICFKVRDITEGLTAAWLDACEFVDVTNFGKDDDEVWTFHAGDQQIKAWSREDFEVVAFS